MTAPRELERTTIAVPESRALDVFAGMLERRGATVLRCPLVAIKDAPDPKPVLAWLRAFVATPPDDLILLTGEGLRRLISCIEAHEPSLRAPFISALAGVRTITRGPKPAKALRELGLRADLPAAQPTTEGVIASVQEEALSGRRIGVQLYGSEPNLRLIDFLRNAGAEPLPVAPYIYADAADDAQVLQLIARMAAGEVDAIAFTSMAQVQRLFRLARREGVEAELRAALDRTAVASVGPVVADALAAEGVRVDAMPEASWFMKPLTASLASLMAEARS